MDLSILSNVTYHLIGLFLDNLCILCELLRLCLFIEDQGLEESLLDRWGNAEVLQVEVSDTGKETFIRFRAATAGFTAFHTAFLWGQKDVYLKKVNCI